MEIRPILSAMLRNKTGAILIALQIAFTLAVVANALFIIYQRWEKIERPTGMDVENIVAFSSQWVGQNINYGEAIKADLRAISALPGVVSVTPAPSVPLSGSGSGRGLSITPGENQETVGAGFFYVDHNAIQTLGLNLIEGRNFTTTDELWRETQTSDQPHNIIITKAMADGLFPDGGALGKPVYLPEADFTVIGIVEQMQGAWVDWDGFERSVLLPAIDANTSFYRYIVRAEPGQLNSLIPRLEETMLAINPRRVIGRMMTLSEYAEDSYRNDSAMMWILLTVIILLLVVTIVGIVGLAAFTVNQRTHQIGTRRALGARQFQILRYFLVENWLITSIGLSIGVVLATGFNYGLATQFETERIDWFYIPLGMVLLWLLGLAAVFGPARRASRVSPAIATRTV